MKINTGLSDADRKRIAKDLEQLLASTFTLYLKTHFFHWNVTGELFVSLHEMFEKQYNELFEAVDTIAERIRALGYPAPGSCTQFRELSFVKETTKTPKALDMVKELLADHETIIRKARDFGGVAEKASDEATVDLINDRMGEHEKTAWMLRSILEG